MDVKNRQQAISKILMKAWRERWTEFEFGIHVKKAFPNSIRLPTDAYNLTDLILEQTLIGAGVNKLLLSYLKHSLYSQLISYPAVIMRITKYTFYDRYFCIKALLEFLITIINDVTCRSKAEESALMSAMMSLVLWLIEMTEKLFIKILELNNVATKGEQIYRQIFLYNQSFFPEQEQSLEKITALSKLIVQNQFLMGVLYLAKLEDREIYEKCVFGYKKIHSWNKQEVVKDFFQMVFVKLDHMLMKELEPRSVEPISFCLQPFMAIEVLVHSSAETSVHVSKFLMIQKLKKYSMARLYCEVIRSCFITLCHVKEVNYRVWGAFFLFKVPQILKQLNVQTKSCDDKLDFSEDIVKAFEMLMECTTILDLLDTTFQCNSIECILMELVKQNLISEENCKRIVEKREVAITQLEKFNIPSTPPPINKFVNTIDPTLNGFIASLRDQITPDFLKLLCTLVVDNRAYLLYSVAGVKGKHKTMINGIMKCNDSCKEISGEASKNKQAVIFRSNIFDISFIMLYSIMQKCGAENFPEMNGEFFFEKWLRDGMVDPTKAKSPMSIVKLCDQSKVDEIITYFSDTSNQQQPPIAFKWNEICMNIPAMLYNVLIAWENETIQPAKVKNILDNMRTKMCCFAVVAASWLCAYIKVLRDDEQAKPRFMVQQLIKPVEESIMVDTFNEKFSLTHEIIMKLYDSRSSLDTLQSHMHQKPLNDLFNEQWKEINAHRWLPYDVAMNLEQLLKSCGAFWMMKNLIEQIMNCKFIKDMEQTMDIVFAIMHLNIEACTEALLREILPILLLNKNQ